tara:strand:- start:3160 stop:4392 length:1233 start_codon:yes stop_codon:yes gene_type:complete
MSIKILMPSLSPTMTEGILQKWHVKIGDQVKAGDIIAEIETDKATMEIEAVDEGIITEILVKEGEQGVLVNSTIAILNGSKSENHSKPSKNKISKIEKNKDNEYEKINLNKDINKPSNNKISKNHDRIIASPYAKKIALEKNIDLKKIEGTGPSGRIIKRDFDKVMTSDLNFLFSDSNESLIPSNIRKIIAERTSYTKKNVPHFYLTIESCVDKLIKLRKKINENNSKRKISINDILVKAIAIAQKQNPQTNVSWLNDKIVKYSSVDVSIAVALDEGLVTPIVKNADTKGIFEISNEINNLIIKAKTGKLKPDEYGGGTISISNLGMYGIQEFAAIINPPQSCILAVGTIMKKTIVDNDEIKIANLIKSTLSADHRVLDGAIAAKLLQDFNDIIENPYNLWLQSNDMEII